MRIWGWFSLSSCVTSSSFAGGVKEFGCKPRLGGPGQEGCAGTRLCGGERGPGAVRNVTKLSRGVGEKSRAFNLFKIQDKFSAAMSLLKPRLKCQQPVPAPAPTIFAAASLPFQLPCLLQPEPRINLPCLNAPTFAHTGKPRSLEESSSFSFSSRNLAEQIAPWDGSWHPDTRFSDEGQLVELPFCACLRPTLSWLRRSLAAVPWGGEMQIKRVPAAPGE